MSTWLMVDGVVAGQFQANAWTQAVIETVDSPLFQVRNTSNSTDTGHVGRRLNLSVLHSSWLVGSKRDEAL